MGSPLRSPLRETHPNPSLPLPLPPPDSVPTLAVKLTPIPLSPSPPHSPPRPTPTPPRTPTPPPPPPPPSAAIVVNRATRDDPTSVTKVEQGTRGIGDGGDRGSKVVSGIMRRSRKDATVRSAGVGVRVSAAVLSLISFSVMAADKTKGWAGDSFDRYKEYRYCISVNIITFIYSSFQAFIQVNQMIKGKHFIRPPLQYYFDLALDQILAYLLISASSSAATRNDDWVSNWGKDPFTIMINGSISMSFLAFVALAISSLISAYVLFSRST